jgi:hypothetical protein
VRTPRHSKTVALATVVYAALTVVYTWPLSVNLRNGVANDLGDPILNAWIMWWTTQAVPLTAAWWNAPIFYSASGALAFSEHLLGQAPIAAPLIALTGSALFGYNVTLLATYLFSALGGYFLAFTLTRRHDAAFVAGLAYGFAPYRLAQLPHIQVLSGYWAPVCLAALHRYDRQRSTPWAAVAAFAWLMQGLSNGYYLFFLTVLLALWLAWFAAGRWSIAQFARVAGFFVVAGLLIAPFLLGYKSILQDTYGFRRGLEEIQRFSADAGALLNASEDLLVWGWLHAVQKPEGELFPGVTVTALALFAVLAARPLTVAEDESTRRRSLRRVLAGLLLVLIAAALLPMYYGPWRLTIGGVRMLSISRADTALTLAVLVALAWMAFLPRVAGAATRRSPLLFYAPAALIMWVFALGPEPMFFERRMLDQAPYDWLMRLPAFDGLRVPARFWMMAVMCLSVVAALAIDRLPSRARRLVAAVAILGVVLDGWPAIFRVHAAPERRAVPPGVSTRLELPINTDRDAAALYQQTFDGVPLVNGFSGYLAPHYYALQELLAAADPRILQALASRGPVGVIVDHATDRDSAYRKFVLAYPGASVHEVHPEWSNYTLPANGNGDLLPDATGTPVRIKALDAFPSPPHTPRATDGDLSTRWSGGVQRSAADFTIELDRRGRVGQVVTDLGEFWTDFPIRVRLDVSPDGSQWDTVYLGDAALHAYYGALRHPRQAPIVFTVNRDNVRFIRLTQLGWGAHDWSIAEVRVLR